MKNIIKSLTLLIVFAPFIISCKKENMGDCFKSTGDISVQYRTLATFDTIEVWDNISVFLTADTFFEVKVEAGEHLLPMIKTEVSNNRLIIKNNNKCNWVRSFKVPINVYVTMPSPGGIINEGNYTFKSMNTLSGRTLMIKMSGSGDVDLKLDIPQLLVNISASDGDLLLDGKAIESYIFCIGSTIVKASSFETEKTYITHHGTGHMYVNASTEIGANIDWIGNVYYSGTANVAYANYTSSGRLIKN